MIRSVFMYPLCMLCQWPLADYIKTTNQARNSVIKSLEFGLCPLGVSLQSTPSPPTDHQVWCQNIPIQNFNDICQEIRILLMTNTTKIWYRYVLTHELSESQIVGLVRITFEVNSIDQDKSRQSINETIRD